MNISVTSIYTPVSQKPAVSKVEEVLPSGDASQRHELDETPRRYAENTARDYNQTLFLDKNKKPVTGSSALGSMVYAKA